MNKKAIVIPSVLLSLGAAIAFGVSLPNTTDSGQQSQADIVEQALPQVSVLNVRAQRQQLTISSFGEVKPRHELKIQAQVEGMVESLSPDFNSGAIIQSDTALITIDDTRYQQSLADAKLALANARVSLLTEERESRQALAEWNRSKLTGEPDSPLVLRQPQLEAAKASVAKADAQVAQAQRNLERTRVRAPFNGIVVSRDVMPGSFVQPGAGIATLYSSDQFEVRLPLPANEWSLLPDSESLSQQKWPVTLTSEDGSQAWQGYIARLENHLDGSNRQRSLIVTIDQPLQRSPQLLPGTFVTATMASRHLDALWKLPASALTRSGYIWYVDGNQTLQRMKVSPLYQNSGDIYLAPQLESEVNILLHPLNNYVPGQKVVTNLELNQNQQMALSQEPEA